MGFGRCNVTTDSTWRGAAIRDPVEPLVDDRAGEPLETGHPTRLHEHSVAGGEGRRHGQRIGARRHAVQVGADGEQLDSGLLQQRSDLGMIRQRVRELGHLTEQRQSPTRDGKRNECFHRCPHRSRVGVVGVVDHGDTGSPTNQLHPPRRQTRIGESRHGSRKVDATHRCHGYRGRCVAGHVRAAHRRARRLHHPTVSRR